MKSSFHRLTTGTRLLVLGLLVITADIRAAEEVVAAATLKTIEIKTPAVPPDWAYRQRHLLDQLSPAAVEFVRLYTREDGTLIWRDEWPGMDGSDDGYESFYNFPLYYALGGPEEIHQLSRTLWDAVTRQFTAYGQVYREFDAYYDWMHHGEGYTYFYFFGLANPTVEKDRQRALRFAGFYIGEDAEAANYDPVHKLIRSPITGSKGPRFVNTAEDWETHREVLAGYPLPYDDIPNVTSSDAWVDDARFPYILETMNRRMMRGDVPLNLTATSMVLNAYMYTGDEKYARWIREYVEAWMDRLRRNNGILPDNVGLNDKIGEYMDGKWWGGYYGWRWPHGLPNQIEGALIGASNAYMVSGKADYLELPRSVLDLMIAKARVENGRILVPHRHGNDGWYDYREIDPTFPIYLWYISRDPRDYERIKKLCTITDWETLHYRKGKGDAGNIGSWFAYIKGRNPDYPGQILAATYEESLRRLELARNDNSDPAGRNVHHWQRHNPIILEGLVQLMLGAPNHIYHGGLLHCSVFYFDPARKRPGVPPDVAALVDRLTPEGFSLHLVNLHPSESREVMLKAGAFGEHQFTEIHQAGATVRVNDRFLRFRIGPGAVGQLKVGLKRYVNRPSYDRPWSCTQTTGH